MKTQCPNCKSKFNVNETNIGKQAKCPKCAKPFTIEPFVETPVAVEAPVKSPEPVVPPVKSPEPVAPPVKIAEPVEPPAPVASPVKSPEPIAPQAKSPAPITLPAKPAEPTKEEKPESKPASKTALSKTVFVYCWMALRIIAGILGGLGLMLAIQKGGHSTLIAIFAAADAFLVCSVLIELALFYKMWAAIQDKEVSISPIKAVGFLFIPVFNIYWALLMLTGFVEDYNSFILRCSIKAGRLQMTLFLIYAGLFMAAAMFVTIPMICVFNFLGLISGAFDGYPLAAWLLLSFVLTAGVGHFIAYIVVATKTCSAINALPERKGR